MTEFDVEQITADLLALPNDVRIQIAEKLIESVEGYATEEIATAWGDEITQRVRDHEEGRVEGVPSEEVFRKARRQLDERNQIRPSG